MQRNEADAFHDAKATLDEEVVKLLLVIMV